MALAAWKVLAWLSVVLVVYGAGIALFGLSASVEGLVTLVVFSIVGAVAGQRLGDWMTDRREG